MSQLKIEVRSIVEELIKHRINPKRLLEDIKRRKKRRRLRGVVVPQA